MKTKTKIRSNAEIRAELDAMPTASREKNRREMRVTEHGGLSRLQAGMVIVYSGTEYRVEYVNDCRARCIPINRQHKTVTFVNKKGEACEFTPETTGGAINISPNADCQIIRSH